MFLPQWHDMGTDSYNDTLEYGERDQTHADDGVGVDSLDVAHLRHCRAVVAQDEYHGEDEGDTCGRNGI